MLPKSAIRVGVSTAVAVLVLPCLFFTSAQAAPQTASGSCVQSGTGVWINNAFPAENSQFAVSYSATPGQTDMNGLVGFSVNGANSISGLVAAVRFAASGMIDVRNGNSFTADVALSYSAGQQYQFQLLINPTTKQYSVFVTPPGGMQVALATNYAFRSNQPAPLNLNNWAMYSKNGTESVCNMTIGVSTSGATATAPAITTQPLSQTIIAGQTATFSITATGTAPLSYQWRKNGTAISGATSSNYTTPAETTSDNGAQFTVMISNSAGTVTSAAATLTVTAPGTLSLSSSTLTFDSITVGTSSNLPATLTNTGNSSVSISGVVISGPGFTASGISVGQIIPVGQTATLNVSFAPASTGSVTGSLTITSNASNSSIMISLSGTGAAAVSHSATLNWTASTSAVIGYYVYRGTVSGGPFTKLTASVNSTTTYSDTTVQAGQTYYYVVAAVNSSLLESVFSNQVSATIP